MKCILSTENIKVFGKAVHALSKFGAALYMEDTSDGLTLKSVNSSKSCFGLVSFARCFFHEYDSQVDAADPVRMICKVSMKSALTIFKHPSTLEKTTEKCQITFDPDDDTKVLVEVFCQYDILKSYELFCMDCEKLKAIYLKDECPNSISGCYRLFLDASKMFRSNESEITLSVSVDSMKINNYTEDDEDSVQQFYSELTLQKDEFHSFNVTEEVGITFSLKEWKAALTFAEVEQLPLGIHFSGPGRPVIFCIESAPAVVADFVFATMAENENGRPRRDRDRAPDAVANRSTSTTTTTTTTAAAKAAAVIREKRVNADVHDDVRDARPGPSRTIAALPLSSLLNNDDHDPSIWDDIEFPDDIIPSPPKKTAVAHLTRGIPTPKVAVERQVSKNGGNVSLSFQSSQDTTDNTIKFKSILSKSTIIQAPVDNVEVLADDTDDYDTDD